MTRFGTPLLAAVMMIFATFSVVNARQERPRVAPPLEAPESQFEQRVAAVGIVEPASELIAVGAHVPGVVSEVLVQAGDVVRAGQPLFRIDDREARANVDVRQARLMVAERQLAELESYPRPEDLPPARADVAAADAMAKEAEVDLANHRRELNRMREVASRQAASRDELDEHDYATRMAEARLETARAKAEQARGQLARIEAGVFGPRIEAARAEVAAARADLEAAQTTLARHTVEAQIDATVLKVDIRVGEYAIAGPTSTPLMLLGVTDPLHVRADVDETDAQRIMAGAAAVAHTRGAANLSAPLEFVRFEPYVTPKRSLTGDPTERADTRVLQVIYRLSPNAMPVFVGQQVDVFIDSSATN